MCRHVHCVKSVQIRSFFSSIFYFIGTKFGPEKTPYLGTVHPVITLILISRWLLNLIGSTRSFKTAIYGTFVRRMRKDVRYCFDKKIMTSTVVEIRIAFLICYLQSLYEIELGHYFCPEFVGHVTNQNNLVDAGKLM